MPAPALSPHVRSSPAINASLPAHPQRSCTGDLGVHRCHDRCVYLTGKDTHAGRSRAASDAVAEPETQLEPVQRAALPPWPLPSPCSILGGPRAGRCSQLSAAHGDAQPGQPPSGLLPHYRRAARCTPRFCPVPNWRRDACRDPRESTAVPVMETGLWRAMHPGAKPGRCWETAATEASACPRVGLRLRGKKPHVYTQQLRFPHCNELLPTLLPGQTAAEASVL